MNDVMEQIKTLSATLDEETTRFHPYRQTAVAGFLRECISESGQAQG